MFSLEALGWNDFLVGSFAGYASDGLTPARVCAEHGQLYRIYSEHGELWADVSGRLRHHAGGPGQLPAAGDWVVIRSRPTEARATIHAILPRRTSFARKAAGQRAVEQVLAANMDTVFLVMSLNRDFNLRRLERYLAAAWESGAAPVVVLTKADLCDSVDERLAEVEAIAWGVPAHAVSVVSGAGLEDLRPYFAPGRTVALLGSSGVGKSTLINWLAGKDLQQVREIRESDGRGRHTTTARELIVLPGGGLVLDTPGLREFGLLDAEAGIRGAFSDFDDLSEKCRFRDCRHDSEPGCAVRAAVEAGEIPPERLESYHKLQSEMEYHRQRAELPASVVEKRRWRAIMKNPKKLPFA